MFKACLRLVKGIFKWILGLYLRLFYRLVKGLFLRLFKGLFKAF